MIDVIIPAYNAEDTIGRALASLVAQTRPRKFMVTVVDDCSTDCTAAVVKKFKGLLPLNYIKLEKNLGRPGLTRNVGIENTSCPYMIFLDADDMLAPEAAEVLSRAILQNQPDFINSAFYRDNRSDNYDVIDTTALTWVHGNVYSRAFLDRNNLRFDDKWNEDGSFNLKCSWLSDKTYVIDKPMCYWMDNKESVTRKNNNFMLDIAEDFVATYVNAIYEILEKRPSVAEEKDFSKMCASKLAMFVQTYDAVVDKEGSNIQKIENLYEQIGRYVELLKIHNLINLSFLKLTNQRFNNYTIYVDAVRQNTLPNYLRQFGINWSEYFNG